MNGLVVTIELDDDRLAWFPGETLAGHYRLDGADSREVKAIELSVLWYTEGKGDEDLAVHFFERQEVASGALVDIRQPRRFSTRLPNSPLSYLGAIVKIRWCVRVRVFVSRGKDIFAEKSFQLGQVPSAHVDALDEEKATEGDSPTSSSGPKSIASP